MSEDVVLEMETGNACTPSVQAFGFGCALVLAFSPGLFSFSSPGTFGLL